MSDAEFVSHPYKLRQRSYQRLTHRDGADLPRANTRPPNRTRDRHHHAGGDRVPGYRCSPSAAKKLVARGYTQVHRSSSIASCLASQLIESEISESIPISKRSRRKDQAA